MSNGPSQAGDPLPPLLDEAVLNQVAGYLPADVLATNLRRLAAHAEALLRLVATDAAVPADQLHALVGSSGMLGFKRLAATCFRHEAALTQDMPAYAASRLALQAAIEATLPAITRRIAG